MTMTTPEADEVLNKQLYLACKQVFGHVKTQNQGQSQQRSLTRGFVCTLITVSVSAMSSGVRSFILPIALTNLA